jgi:chaperonin GroEL (HSP60 family)
MKGKTIYARIEKIAGGISTVIVGGVTPSEVRKSRVTTLISAVRASKDGGVVAGGGIT